MESLGSITTIGFRSLSLGNPAQLQTSSDSPRYHTSIALNDQKMNLNIGYVPFYELLGNQHDGLLPLSHRSTLAYLVTGDIEKIYLLALRSH